MALSSTQQAMDIAGIREGIVLLKNGAYRLILSASAINFSLKSEEEQNSLIFQYQSFLNSLHFPIQIVMRSQRLDLNPYLKKISEKKEQLDNELLRFQTEDYIDFISQLINLANIMKKTFYVVISYDPINIAKNSVVDKLFKKKDIDTGIKVTEIEFKRYKEELTQRANIVASGLGGMGIRCVQLNTEEIIGLFYEIYNPEIADKARFTDIDEITSGVVSDANRKDQIIKNEMKKLKDEEVIDNTQIVEDQRKKDAQIKDREAIKAGERHVASTPAQTTPTPAKTTATQTSAQEPGQPVNNISAPINEKVGAVDNPASATFNQTSTNKETNTNEPTNK